jgi:hypothetical protein
MLGLVNCLNSIEASYRAELRDLFDAHFGRFEEKLERRLTEFTGALGSSIAHLRSDLEVKIEQVRGDLELKIEQLRAGLEPKIEQVRADLDLKIEQVRVELQATKSDLLKWTIGVWLPVGLAVLGLYFKR